MDQNHFTKLLEAYRSLWHNRKLAGIDSAESILLEAVRRELLDENAHPRTRRTVHEKFYLAAKRIVESELDNSDKVKLFELHVKTADALFRENQ